MQNINQSRYHESIKLEDSHLYDYRSSSSIPPKVQKKNPNLIDGSWTSSENLKYAVFVDKHQTIFISKQKRKYLTHLFRASRIYTYLSKFLRSRTAQQCRSHFQKIILKHNSIHAFIRIIKDTVSETVYEKIFNDCPVAEDAFSSIN